MSAWLTRWVVRFSGVIVVLSVIGGLGSVWYVVSTLEALQQRIVEETQALAELQERREVLMAEVTSLEAEITKLDSDVDYRDRLLRADSIVEPDTDIGAILPERMQAERALATIALDDRVNTTDVRYYTKASDEGRGLQEVLRVLVGAGFSVDQVPAVSNDDPTNALFFGDLVTMEQIRYVAYTVMGRGVQLRVIRPFERVVGKKRRLIQIGAEPSAVDWTPWTVELLERTETFPDDGAVPSSEAERARAVRLLAELAGSRADTRDAAAGALLAQYGSSEAAIDLALTVLEDPERSALPQRGVDQVIEYLVTVSPQVYLAGEQRSRALTILERRRRSEPPLTPELAAKVDSLIERL